MEVRTQHFCMLMFCCALLLSGRANALELNGVASFNELGEEIYLAALHVDNRTSDPAALFSNERERKMEVRFSSSMSRRRWSTNWLQSIAINNSRDHLEAAVGELSEVLGAFKGNLFRGDRVEIHYLPGEGTDIRVNGHLLASGHSADVFNLFLSSWMGPVPPSSQFRNQLMGVESSPDQTRFVTLQPALDRIETVAAWITDAPGASDQESGTETAAGEELVASNETAPAAEQSEQLQIEVPVIPSPTLAVAEEDVDVAAATPAPAEPVPAEQIVAALPSGETEEFLEEDDDDLDLSVEAILGQRDYMSQLIREIYANLRYPERAVRRNFQGSVRMRLLVSRDGSLSDMQVVENSRHAVLNAEAERAVLAAAPFSPVPEELRGDFLEVELPINFRLE